MTLFIWGFKMNYKEAMSEEQEEELEVFKSQLEKAKKISQNELEELCSIHEFNDKYCDCGFCCHNRYQKFVRLLNFMV